MISGLGMPIWTVPAATAPTPAAPPPAAVTLDDLLRQYPRMDRVEATRFLQESNSVEGRRVKLEGLERIYRACPTFTAANLRVTAAFVNESTSIAGRKLKLDSVAELASTRPALSADFLGGVARFVNANQDINERRPRCEAMVEAAKRTGLGEDAVLAVGGFVGNSTNLAVRALKWELVDTLYREDPRTDAPLLQAVAKLVDESTSADGRRAKCSALIEVAKARHGLTETLVDRIGAFVNAATDLSTRLPRLDAISQLAARLPALSDDDLVEMAKFVGSSTSAAVRKLKIETVEKLHPDRDLLSAIKAFVDESTSAEGRELKLKSLQAMAAKRALSGDQVRSIARLVNASDGIPGRKLKLEAMQRLLAGRDAPAPLIDAIESYVDAPQTLEERKPRLSLMVKLALENPDADANAFKSASTAARDALDTGDGNLRIAAALPEAQARALLARELPLPAPSISAGVGQSMALLKKLDADPLVVSSEKALRASTTGLARFERALAANRDALFHMEDPLMQRTWAAEWQKRSFIVQAASLATLALGAGATFFVIPEALRTIGMALTAAAGLIGAPFVARRILKKQLPPVVEATMRKSLEAPRQYWTVRAQETRALRDESREAALRRIWSQQSQTPQPTPPLGTVEVEDEAVTIGGVRVDRRPGE